MKTILTAAALAALVFSSAALAQGSLPTNFTGDGPGGSVWVDGRLIGHSSDPGERARILFKYTREQTAGTE